MHKTINNISKTRQYLLQVTEGMTAEALNTIPAGFSNNIIWNMGHLVAAQQGLCYVRTGHRDLITDLSFLTPTSRDHARKALRVQLRSIS